MLTTAGTKITSLIIIEFQAFVITVHCVSKSITHVPGVASSPAPSRSGRRTKTYVRPSRTSTTWCHCWSWWHTRPWNLATGSASPNWQATRSTLRVRTLHWGTSFRRHCWRTRRRLRWGGEDIDGGMGSWGEVIWAVWPVELYLCSRCRWKVCVVICIAVVLLLDIQTIFPNNALSLTKQHRRS